MNDDFLQLFKRFDNTPDLHTTLRNRPELQRFWNDQREAIVRYEDLNLRKGMRWSVVTLRVCLSIFIRSTSAYEALRTSGVLVLPSGSLLRTYIRGRASLSGTDEAEGMLARESYLRHLQSRTALVHANYDHFQCDMNLSSEVIIYACTIIKVCF